MNAPVHALGTVLIPGASQHAGALAGYRRASWYKRHPQARRLMIENLCVHKRSFKALGTGNSSSSRRYSVALRQAPKPIPPQRFVGKLRSQLITPQVIYRYYKGVLNINVIDANLVSGEVGARPVLAGGCFNQLSQVKNEAARSQAIAAVNANYFKRGGTPLGTLIVDNEWVSGSLYDRVSMGFTRYGYARMDCVDLHGVLKTSNPDLPSMWINNLNQPRLHGAKLVMYTRRWGPTVRLACEGCLVAVDALGKVCGRSDKQIAVPSGGYVLSDRAGSSLFGLQVGESVSLQWCPQPSTWSDVVQAVSGGPILVKDGRLYVDLKAESFRGSWTSSRITARTALGVTANNHLLLVTVEGPHTLWDMAKFMQRLGAVDAMNLDGGGSTTMVVAGKIVTKNALRYQRPVADALAIVPTNSAEQCRSAEIPSWLMNVQESAKLPPFGIEQSADARP